MDLPVEKWKLLVSQKLTLLEPALKDKLSCTVSLRDTFLLSLSLFCPEDEECLFNLSRYYSVKKDPDLVLLCKEKGNQKFYEKKYRAAAVLYSRALSHAETSSPEMAVCYANRSAALFHLGHFEVCLEDIERALEKGYPDRLHLKILLRKSECLFSLGRTQKALEVLDSMESRISAEQCAKTASHQALLRKCSQLKAKARKGSSSSVFQPDFPNGTQRDLGAWKENGRIACASPSVSLNVSPCKGRHLVAAKAIHPGELLVKEEAFARVLRPGGSLVLQGSKEAALDGQPANEDLHCHHCLEQLLAPIPCRGCSYAKYCSQACAQVAWEGYHRMECPLGGALLALGVFCHLAFRAVLLSGFEEVRKCIERSHREGDDDSPSRAPASRTGTEGSFAAAIPGCSADGKYRSCYRTIFSLLTHAEKHSLEFRFLCSLTAVALCRVIQDAGLEGLIVGESAGAEGREPGTTSSELDILGEAVLRHLLQLQCNAQAVTSLQVPASGDGPVAASEQVRLASALFPVLSLLNHSCDPNTSVSFRGSMVEVRALRAISEEEEILHCYGPHRCKMGVKERRERLLSQYFFECRCQSCLEDLQAVSRDRAPSCQTLFCCPSCHRLMKQAFQGQGLLWCSSKDCGASVPEEDFHHQLRGLQLQIEKGVKILERGEPGQSMELLLKCKQEAEKFLSPVHLTAGKIEDSLARVWALLGDWQKAAKHLHLSIKAVEAHYGPSSIEAGQELFKLAQVCFNGQAVSEALRAIRKAEEVLSVHLGMEDSQVQELRAMKACLEELPAALRATTAEVP